MKQFCQKNPLLSIDLLSRAARNVEGEVTDGGWFVEDQGVGTVEHVADPTDTLAEGVLTAALGEKTV